MSADSARPAASVVVPHRFRGPRRSGNGGYTAGLLADQLATHLASDVQGRLGAVEVTLRRPPPLDTPLLVIGTAAGVELRSGDTLVAEATRSTTDMPAGTVPRVPYEEARGAESAYGGLVRHPFPECFTCGTGRTPGDGLCLRPGGLGDGRTACTWTPTGDLAGAEVLWAALDCPGGWAADVAGRPMVLGRITAAIMAPPMAGAPYVVMGQLLDDHDGRKVHTASTVYDPDGEVLATARHVWITVDPAAFGEATGEAAGAAAGEATGEATGGATGEATGEVAGNPSVDARRPGPEATRP